MINPAPLAPAAQALRSGEVQPVSVMEELNNRIEAYNPQLQAFLPDADRRANSMRAAAALPEIFPDPAMRPALYGIAAGIKDIFRVEGYPTRAGAQLPPELFEGPEAHSVRLLREAGTVIAGKTVTTEFAYFEPGPTRNPHNPEHTPGGSSSGSAAAVAAGLCHLALGTQTIGSVIRPAAYCGVVGFKPSYGRIPTAGIIYFAPSVDTIGLFTQDVAGMELAAGALCDNWLPLTPAAARIPPVLGVPEGAYLWQVEPEGLTNFEEQVRRLQTAGYEVRRTPLFENIEAINHRHRRLVAAEFAQLQAEWFRQHAPLYRPRTAELIIEGQAIERDELDAALAGRYALRAEVEESMEQAGIDLWLTPAAPGPAPHGLAATGSPVMNLPWSYTGHPALTVPGGISQQGLPVGLQLIGRFMADERLTAWAAILAEQIKPGIGK